MRTRFEQLTAYMQNLGRLEGLKMVGMLQPPAILLVQTLLTDEANPMKK